MFKLFPILIILALFSVSGGCETQNAIDMRSAEFAYTPEKLGTELANRLKAASDSRARSKAESELGADVRERESDRGGDGGRPNPASVEAIITDAIVKIKGLEDAETGDAAVKVLAIVNADSDISAEVLQEFERGVNAGLITE